MNHIFRNLTNIVKKRLYLKKEYESELCNSTNDELNVQGVFWKYAKQHI